MLSASFAGLNIAYETPAGASSLVGWLRTVGRGRSSWSRSRSTGFPRSSPGGRCVHVSNKTGEGVIYATYQRQFYVKLISPSPFEG